MMEREFRHPRVDLTDDYHHQSSVICSVCLGAMATPDMYDHDEGQCFEWKKIMFARFGQPPLHAAMFSRTWFLA